MRAQRPQALAHESNSRQIAALSASTHSLTAYEASLPSSCQAVEDAQCEPHVSDLRIRIARMLAIATDPPNSESPVQRWRHIPAVM